MAAPSTGPPVEGDQLTIDELALSTGLTVRTTRYYASLGLLPPPERRGRMAYYGTPHLARLQLIRALQDHGFTLAAIERYLENVPMDASAEELAVQRALLTAWKPSQSEDLTRAELEAKVGRPLSEDDLDWLSRALAIRRLPTGEFRAFSLVDVALQVHDLDTPLEAIVEANAAVRRHMAELADELSRILHENVVSQYQREGLSMEDAERLERTLTGLRALTLDAIVNAFQRAANEVARQGLTPVLPTASVAPDA